MASNQKKSGASNTGRARRPRRPRAILNLLNSPRLDIINVTSNRHLQDQRTLLQQGNVIQNALSKIGEWEKCHVVHVLVELFPDLGPEFSV